MRVIETRSYYVEIYTVASGEYIRVFNKTDSGLVFNHDLHLDNMQAA